MEFSTEAYLGLRNDNGLVCRVKIVATLYKLNLSSLPAQADLVCFLQCPTAVQRYCVTIVSNRDSTAGLCHLQMLRFLYSMQK